MLEISPQTQIVGARRMHSDKWQERKQALSTRAKGLDLLYLRQGKWLTSFLLVGLEVHNLIQLANSDGTKEL